MKSYQMRQPEGDRSWLEWSRTWTYLDGEWLEGNIPIVGPRTHAFWLGSSVFDGARAFEGVTPDLDKHCARVNASARTLGLEPGVDVDTMVGLVREGLKDFPQDAAIYIRPMYWAEQGRLSRSPGRSGIDALPALPLRNADAAADRFFGHRLSPIAGRRVESMPTDAKAGCLYPNNGRAITEARIARLRQCTRARHARQRGGDRHLERLHGQGRSRR